MSDIDWSDAVPAPGSLILSAGVRASALDGEGALLISGDLDVAIAEIAKGAPVLGLLETGPETGPFALRIARDRALLCSDLPLQVRAGWQDAGFAVSAADDLYFAIRLEGEKSGLVLAGLLGDVVASRSALTLTGESACLLSRRGDGIDIRVPRAEASALWSRISVLAASV